MGNVVAIVAILLALIAAGSIAYVAWELTSEDEPVDEPESTRPTENE